MIEILFDDQVARNALQHVIVDSEPRGRQERNAVDMLRQHPFFKVWAKGKYQSRRTDFEGAQQAPLSRFFAPLVFERFQSTFETALRQLALHSDNYIDKKLDLMSMIHGLSNLNLDAMTKFLGGNSYETYKIYREQVLDILFPRQLIIVLTYHCNLNCNFCFSKMLEKTEPDYLKEEMLEKIMAWMKGKGFKRVCLFGGEPTIHPDFIHIIHRFQQSGYEVYFASNGLYSPVVAEHLSQSEILKITLNVLSKKEYRPSQLQRLMDNLSQLPPEIQLSLRYTLANNHDDLSFFKELIEQFHPGDISVALAFPDKQHGNNYIDSDQIADFSSSLLEFIEIGRRFHLQPVMAKPIPYCAFNDRDLLNIVAGFEHLSACDIYLDSYLQLTTINHKGVFYPCHALESFRQFTIDDNPDLQQMQHYHAETVGHFRAHPVLDKCMDCNLYRSRICQGFCFSYYDTRSKNG